MMEAADVAQLMAEQVNQIDMAFQFWLGSTFAVIVAMHAIRESIDLKLKVVVVGLYLLLVLFSVTKTIGDFQQLVYLDEMASLLDYDPPNEFSQISGMLRFAIYFLGTIATIVFVSIVDADKK